MLERRIEEKKEKERGEALIQIVCLMNIIGFIIITVTIYIFN
jgi:hypothetical protein